MLVHGVRISNVKTTDQAEAARDLEFKNAALHPGLCIKWLSWPRGIQKTGKLYTSLTIYLTAPGMANRVIEQGLVESGEVQIVERFQTGCGLVQCFKCCSHGHIAKHRRVSARCGHCSGHETRECTTNERSICANCTGKGHGSAEHKAWSEGCPAVKRLRKSLQLGSIAALTHIHRQFVWTTVQLSR